MQSIFRFIKLIFSFSYYCLIISLMFSLDYHAISIPLAHIDISLVDEEIEEYYIGTIVDSIILLILFFIWRRPFIKILDFLFYLHPINKLPMGFFVFSTILGFPIMMLGDKYFGTSKWGDLIMGIITCVLAYFSFVLFAKFYSGVREYLVGNRNKKIVMKN